MYMSTGTVLCTHVNITSWIHDLAQYRALARYNPKGDIWYRGLATERGSTITELYNDDDDDDGDDDGGDDDDADADAGGGGEKDEGEDEGCG